MSEPPDDAYSRVTNPERFAPLHAVADALVADLVLRFDVTLTALPAPLDGPKVEGRPTLQRIVLVEPAGEGAAPLRVAWTTFPGLRLTVGRWHEVSFPNCGCDACAERAADGEAELLRNVQDLTSGQFAEWWDGERVGHRWGSASRSSGWGLVLDDDRRRLLGEPWTIEWAPWPRRTLA